MFIWKDMTQLAHVENIHTSKWQKIPTERICSRQRQNLSCTGSHDHKTFWPLWNWNEDRFHEERRDSILDVMSTKTSRSLLWITQSLCITTKSLQARGSKRIHLRHQPCRSNKEIGRIYFPFQGPMTTMATQSLNVRQEFYDTVMIFEELTEQLNGDSCYPGFLSRKPRIKNSGQCKYGWITCGEEATRKDSSMYKSRTLWLNPFISLVLLFLAIFFFNQTSLLEG